ncbi:Wzz/FepE/Etk N-terminal domain-containing protein [Paraflavitalea speifideaquila]|uniref:Wzz/FepE/Etk N-terminal domain-containing protein n=1 Tax=Paraflavitalea speifideaquila TaxID=3076558 RepID=UPI0028ED3AD8|nr:Wzz/FepE/Etk N-terminal domain-containing protein [Paraflavitalea speifideiaquila]
MEQTYVEANESNTSFDIKRFFSKIVKNYLWFIAAIIVFVGGAYAYLRFAVPLYQVAAFIQVQPPNDATNMLGGSPFASPGAASARNYPDINGEIFKLQSASLIGEVVDSLKLDIELTTMGRIQHKPVALDQLPFAISVKRKDKKQKSPAYTLRLNNGAFELQNEKKKDQRPVWPPIDPGRRYLIAAANCCSHR